MLQSARDIKIGGIAFHCTGKSEDHLPHPAFLHALHERIYLKIRRTNTIHRRYDTSQHMIETMILLGILNSHNILHILHHTDGGRIACMVGTNGTHFCIADVMTNTTVAHIVPQMDNSIGKAVHLLWFQPKQMECQAKSCFAPYARQSLQFVHRPLEELGGIFINHRRDKYLNLL